MTDNRDLYATQKLRGERGHGRIDTGEHSGRHSQSPVVSYSYLGEYELYPAAVRVRTQKMYQVAAFKPEMMTLGALVRVDE